MTSGLMLASPSTANLQFLASRLDGLEIGRRELLQSQYQHLAGDHLLERLAVRGQLVADRRANEVGAVRIEALGDEQVDVTEVDEAEVDRDLFGFGNRLGGDKSEL